MFFYIFLAKLYLYLRNRKHSPCFYTVIETRVEVWENEKLKWEHESRTASASTLFRVLQNFDECLYNAWEHGENVFYFFYKVTSRKLKRGNSILYHSVNSPYCSWWRMQWRIIAWTRLLVYQSSHFQNVILWSSIRLNVELFKAIAFITECNRKARLLKS